MSELKKQTASSMQELEIIQLEPYIIYKQI